MKIVIPTEGALTVAEIQVDFRGFRTPLKKCMKIHENHKNKERENVKPKIGLRAPDDVYRRCDCI